MATRSDIGVAPKSFAATLRLPLPLGILSGLVSATAGLGSSSDFGSISQDAISNDAIESDNNDAVLRLFLLFRLLEILIFIMILVTMAHNHPLHWHVFRPFPMHLLADGPAEFL